MGNGAKPARVIICQMKLKPARVISHGQRSKEQKQYIIIMVIIIIIIDLPINLAETVSADVRLLKLVFVNACLVAAGVSYLCFLILVSKNVPAWMFRFFVWCVLLR